MKLSFSKVCSKKMAIPNSLSALKLIKFKEKYNEKLFSKMASNSMSPQQQNLIKARFDGPVLSYFNNLLGFS